jgi:hypothetical protein
MGLLLYRVIPVLMSMAVRRMGSVMPPVILYTVVGDAASGTAGPITINSLLDHTKLPSSLFNRMVNFPELTGAFKIGSPLQANTHPGHAPKVWDKTGLLHLMLPSSMFRA